MMTTMLRKPLEKAISLTVLCNRISGMSIRSNSTIGTNTVSRISQIFSVPEASCNGFSPPSPMTGNKPMVWLSTVVSPLTGSRLPLEVSIPVPFVRPAIGIINKRPLYEDPRRNGDWEIDDPLLPFMNIIDCPLSENSDIEKHAAKLVVIRRIKMNKHKLKKLRKRMKFKWDRIKMRRKTRREKAWLDEKLAQIRMFEKFDAKEFVNDCIRRAKEVPIPRRWQDPLMPAWYKEEQMLKEEKYKRYKDAVNLYLNKGIDFKPTQPARYVGEKRKDK